MAISFGLAAVPKGSKDLNEESLAQAIAVIVPYSETQSSHCIGTSTLGGIMVGETIQQRFPERNYAPPN